jgi:sulfur-oxidizing protein SoxX
MKASIAAAVISITATAASADTVGPADVAFNEYFGVEVSLTGAPGDPAAGREVFSSRSAGNCVACHTVSEMLDDVAWHGDVGPSLDGVADRWDEADIRGLVVNAKNIYDGTIMPAFYKTSGFIRPGEGYTTKPAQEPLQPILSAEQIEDVVAYLMTLQES